MQELGSDYYKLHHRYESEGDDKYEAMRRIEWEEEEEKAKTEYFKKIAEEEKRGYYRKTVTKMIEERSLAEEKERERSKAKK